VIKQQIDDDENLAMNFKTSNLNPYICNHVQLLYIIMYLLHGEMPIPLIHETHMCNM